MLSLYLYASNGICLTTDPDHRRHCYSSLDLIFVTHEAATSNVLYQQRDRVLLQANQESSRVLRSLLRESTPLISLRSRYDLPLPLSSSFVLGRERAWLVVQTLQGSYQPLFWRQHSLTSKDPLELLDLQRPGSDCFRSRFASHLEAHTKSSALVILDHDRYPRPIACIPRWLASHAPSPLSHVGLRCIEFAATQSISIY